MDHKACFSDTNFPTLSFRHYVHRGAMDNKRIQVRNEFIVTFYSYGYSNSQICVPLFVHIMELIVALTYRNNFNLQ